jgi:hypothetical protein
VYVLRQNCRAAGWRWDTKKILSKRHKYIISNEQQSDKQCQKIRLLGIVVFYKISLGQGKHMYFSLPKKHNILKDNFSPQVGNTIQSVISKTPRILNLTVSCLFLRETTREGAEKIFEKLVTHDSSKMTDSIAALCLNRR